MSSLNYSELANKFKPNQIKALLIAESPPRNGKYYFYKIPKSKFLTKPIIQNSTLSATIFNHYFNKQPKNSSEYGLFLKTLKEIGVFLIDIFPNPLEIRTSGGLNEANIKKLISKENLEKLKKRINTLNPEKVIFLLPRTRYRNVLINKFPKASFITWICFRMYINEAKNINNYKFNQMLINQTGSCEKCGYVFNSSDTIQSTNFKCKVCLTENILCKKCKDENCQKCGGVLLDKWEQLPNVLF